MAAKTKGSTFEHGRAIGLADDLDAIRGRPVGKFRLGCSAITLSRALDCAISRALFKASSPPPTTTNGPALDPHEDGEGVELCGQSGHG